MTVKDCVINLLKEQPHLSNELIAEKVRATMNSNTTAKNVAWYKWKHSIDTVESSTNTTPVEVTDEDLEAAYGEGDQMDEEEIEYWSKAEELVVKYEKQKGARVKRISKTSTPGYDIISLHVNGEERYIEVKSKKKGKMTWLNLTSNETSALLNEPKFWLYIVEGDISKGSIEIAEISRIELLKAVKIKLHGRISNLSSFQRNKHSFSVSTNNLLEDSNNEQV
jgi:hypothetical protein